MTRGVRENFIPKPFYHIGTPPEEFPEVFPLNSETEEEEGDDIRILYTRMIKAVDQEEANEAPVSSEDLEPITNPFYERPGFTDSEEEVDESESLGVCTGCGSKLELTCKKPCRSESSKYPRVPDLYLEKIVIFVYRGSFEVKGSRMTSKHLMMQQSERASGFRLTLTPKARRKKSVRLIKSGWYAKSFMIWLNGLSWMRPMATMIGVLLKNRTPPR